MDKRTAITFASDGNYAIGVCANIMSLEEKSPYLADEYIIYYENWDQDLIDKLLAYSNKIKFIEYTKEMFIEKYDKKFYCDLEINNFLDIYSHFKAIFSEILMLLKEFDQVIFMDSDFIVLSDISELKKINNVAWRGSMYNTYYKNKSLDRPNAGLLVFPNKIPYQKLSDKFMDYFIESKSDELAITRMMYDFNIEVEHLPFGYNYVPAFFERADVSKDIFAFHLTGRNKLWNDQLMRCLFPEYNRYFNYFSYDCLSKHENTFQNRTEFINFNLRTDIWRRFLFNKSLDNKFIRLDPSTIFKGELQFYYKDYDCLKFRVRNIEFGNIRIYFHVYHESIYKLCEYIKERHDLQKHLLMYKFYDYNESTKTFYCDVNCKELSVRFNQMVNFFTKIIDEFFLNVDFNEIQLQNANLQKELIELQNKVDKQQCIISDLMKKLG